MILTHFVIIGTIVLSLTTMVDSTVRADGFCGPLGTSQSFMETNDSATTTLKDIRIHEDKEEFVPILQSLITKFGYPPVVPDRLIFHKVKNGNTTVSIHSNGCAIAWFILDKASVTELLGDPV